MPTTWILYLSLVGQVPSQAYQEVPSQAHQEHITIPIDKFNSILECKDSTEQWNKLLESTYWNDYIEFLCLPKD